MRDSGTVAFWNTIGLVARQCLFGVEFRMMGLQTYIIQNGAFTGVFYRDEILHEFVRPYAGAVGEDFVLMDDNASPHLAQEVTEYLEHEVQSVWTGLPDLQTLIR